VATSLHMLLIKTHGAYSICWARLADDLQWPGSNPGRGMGFQLVGLMARKL